MHTNSLLLVLALCLFCLVPAASAVFPEVTEKGTITALDSGNGTMTILFDTRYACNYSATPSCRWEVINESAETRGTVIHGEMTVLEDLVRPGEKLMYSGRNDNSSISVTFLRGEASSFGCTGLPVVSPGPQPVSVFLIHVNPPIGFEAENVSTPTTVPTTTTATARASPSTPLLSLAASLLGCAAVFKKRR
ncbi:hypothetical protein J2129_002554 [Methanofollis sp. W23]|uniref:hypothetical protein n=1 Tax=Methanofollis sp. W23 TaxID=2817849 RepID=UPI001AE93DDD|nr:hypothetical protein [Methanofollis sp. W23]MBP2147100.1 hypothetical protein [Methanofollis sp. W23]